MLATRSAKIEELDGHHVDSATYQRCISELDRINRITLTHWPTLRWLDKVTKDLPSSAEISILDVAYGHGDLLRKIAVWACRRGFRAKLMGVDLNPRSAETAFSATPSWMKIKYLTCDVFTFDAGEVDFIVNSQFTHHLTDLQVVEFLHWLEDHAVRGWHIADLHRSSLAYAGFGLLARVMGFHRVVRKDGLTSIARSFHRGEWQMLLNLAGINADVKWHMGFRYTVSTETR
ncbi:MAG: methyltransferase domain-containing protein [Mycobacterium sp.]